MGKDEEWMRMRSIRLLKTSTHQPEGGGQNDRIVKNRFDIRKVIGFHDIRLS